MLCTESGPLTPDSRQKGHACSAFGSHHKTENRKTEQPLKNMKSELIKDGESLNGAKTLFGNVIQVYDDGFGPLWIHRDSMGISGIVRAQTWEDAYSICEDEFFPAADDDAGKEMEEIESMPDGEEKNHAQACWDESYGFRGNMRGMPDGSLSSIYAKDLNGDSLDRLTPELLAELEISLDIQTDE